jgi:L-ascorbate metabolism protein UlaG (beta-lactamase superfamily)
LVKNIYPKFTVKSLRKMGVLSIILILIAGNVLACKTAATTKRVSPILQPPPTSEQPQSVPDIPTDWWAGEITIKYLAHSSFQIKSAKGIKIITDPYTPSKLLDYSPISESADIVTVSSERADSNNIGAVNGQPVIIRETGIKSIKGIDFEGIASALGDPDGAQPDQNTIFVFTVDGIRFCHLGDLGLGLSPEQISRIGRVDVLFIPVGGYDTIDAQTATEIVNILKPVIAIPMHYQTRRSESLPFSPVEDFLQGKENWKKLLSIFVIDPEEPRTGSQILVFPPSKEGCKG